MDCPCTLKDLWPFEYNVRRQLWKCPLIQGKKRKGHWEEYGKDREKKSW